MERRMFNDRNLFKMTLAVLALPIVIAAGCQERYRYPCQDPANWDKAQCQKPLCEVHRQCPDLIFKEDAAKVGIKHDQISKPNIQKTCEKGCENGN
jgi:hypothetical protein